MLAMYLTNRVYFTVLIDNPSGQKVLTFSVVTTILGVLVINKMSKLDTSR